MKIKPFGVLVANMKGGVGKTTISSEIVAPFMFYLTNEIVRVIEIDNRIKTEGVFKSCNQFYTNSYEQDEGISEAQEALFDIRMGSPVVFDCGGGDDSIKAIDKILNMVNDEFIVFVPLFDGDSGAKEALSMYKKIRSKNKLCRIVFVLNKCLKVKNYEKEFVDFFGSEDYDIEGINQQLDDRCIAIPLLNNKVFELVRKYNLNVCEMATGVFDIQAFLNKEHERAIQENNKKYVRQANAKVNIYNESVACYNEAVRPFFEVLKAFLCIEEIEEKK